MKNKYSYIFVALIIASPTLHADESLLTRIEKLPTDHNFISWLFTFSRMKGVKPVKNKTYEDECGACHFPYQPGLLPSASWEKILDAKQLSNHYGDDAELDEDTRLKILTYLKQNSAEKSWYKRSRKIMASLDEGQVPMRITQTPYIKEKHSEIPEKMIKGNKDVGSLSNCNKCHREAAKGIYDDDTVYIPNYGRNWED